MKARLDVYERQAAPNLNQSVPAAPVQSGPSFTEQKMDLENQIDALDDKIEEASADGRSIKNYLRKQSLILWKSNLNYKKLKK